MTTNPTASRANLRLNVLGQELVASIEVPEGLMKPQQVLPAAWSITDAVVGVASAASAAVGKPVSCRQGCAACCRQLVTLAPVEAMAIADLVNAMPDQQREVVRGRFADAIARMRAAGLVEPGSPDHTPVLRAPAARSAAAAFDALLDAYFALRIACPFLDKETCGIYVQRPTICREYLITSPPENCDYVGEKPTRGVKLPVYLSDKLVGFGQKAGVAPMKIPLPFALAWAAEHRQEMQGDGDARVLLTDLVARVHGK
jgi:Fe-S-cluster containining protein